MGAGDRIPSSSSADQSSSPGWCLFVQGAKTQATLGGPHRLRAQCYPGVGTIGL